MNQTQQIDKEQFEIVKPWIRTGIALIFMLRFYPKPSGDSIAKQSYEVADAFVEQLEKDLKLHEKSA